MISNGGLAGANVSSLWCFTVERSAQIQNLQLRTHFRGDDYPSLALGLDKLGAFQARVFVVPEPE